MIIKEKDFVVIVDEKNKKHLVLVESVKKAPKDSGTDTTYSGVINNADMYNSECKTEVEFAKREAVANLGSSPFCFGSVFGVKIETYAKSIKIQPWGEVHVFTELSDADLEVITTSLQKVGGIAKQRGWFASKQIRVELRPPAGKLVASYKHNRKDDKDDIFILRPKDEDLESLDSYVGRETGNSLWYNLVTAELKSKWVAVFIKSTVLSQTTDVDIKSIIQDLKQTGSCKELLASLKEDESRLLLAKEIFRFFKRVHALEKADIDFMLEDKEANLDEISPKNPLEIGAKSVIISDSAMKSARSLFAEAFSLYLLDKESLPKNIRVLMKQTLAAV